MVGNILIYLGVVVGPTVVFALVLKLPRLVERMARRRMPVAPGIPVEKLAADLRRVHAALQRLAPDAPVVRRRATSEAYDALLAQACSAVEITHQLDSVPRGIEREVERLRVEEKLREAGLVIP
ncbi:hypothetical protein BAY61_31525 [Prauserella marina]|uniref:Uncharacterized protein n=1 Tax=Prauserella marina TaxID=530584 RepID=A0A222VYM3_9PSEU|nr:hypothetical protein [Prauserella marina]ASR38783.1 hypothetical protein BAY61_31525 [Prauserella marina]PWV82141.1 hypothetical protein DES30_102377 [Prauserella marina]SDD20229.1 hypothetical protein SAMN05421630_106377 [Prauserella marina]